MISCCVYLSFSWYNIFSCSRISLTEKRYFFILAGIPQIIEYGGHDFVTTEPAAIIDPRPIVTPFKIVTLAPAQTSSSIVMGESFWGSFMRESTINFTITSVIRSPEIIISSNPKMFFFFFVFKFFFFFFIYFFFLLKQ